MKFRVTVKDPDVFADAVQEAVEDELATLDLHEDELEAVGEKRRERTMDAISKWVEYGEYIVVEFDTEAGTAVVVPKGR